MIQLRTRSEFSFKTTFGPIQQVADACKATGASSAAVVDGGTWSHVRWAAACAKAGIRPIFGTELTVPTADDRRPVAWALAAKNRTRDFYALSTAARAPGADVKALFAAADGVHRFAGVALDDPACFDFIDINPASLVQQQRALALSKKTGRPLVVTGDNYYPLPSDKGAFQAMGGRERSTPQHILSMTELRSTLSCLSDAQFKRAMATAKEIAADCASDLPAAPLIKVPGDFRAMVEKGRKSRLARGHIAKWTKAYDVRLRREIEAIEQKEFQSYFLVVADLVAWAKTRMLVGPGRGSSAGSLLCYLAGITEVDPIPHGLLFERFIDFSRNDLPDIDIDFNDNKREEVFEYLQQKYGNTNIARIGNVNSMQARSVLAQVCRRFDISDRDRFDLVNVMIEYSSGDARYGKGIEDTFVHTDVGRRFAEQHKDALVMTRLENHATHTGVHAAGVIVSNVPISDYATMGPDGIAQIDKIDAEALNLLKIDALGLRTLGVIEDAGVVTPEKLYSLKLDDPKVFHIFNNQHYSAIFQFEGPAQRQVSSQVDIDSFRTIDHVTALARPGPFAGGATQKYIDRKAGRSPVATNHPRMTEILQDTYGVVIYQEQVMRIGRDIGKLTWEEVTLLRKAMSKSKGEEYFNQKEDQFIEGAASQKIDAATAKLIWREICTFGSWGMNRCMDFSTKIKLCHPNQFDGAAPTIEHLYKRYKLNPTKWMKQRKAMPILLALGNDGRARPTTAVDIVKSGKKECIELSFFGGRKIKCTAEHRFIINDGWATAGTAQPGDEFRAVKRDTVAVNRAIRPGGQDWAKGEKWIDGKRPELNGKTREYDAFRAAMIESLCQEKGCKKIGRQVHHNDFAGGMNRPKDLAWLCDSHHKKRHIDHGDRRPPYARGHKIDEPAILQSVRTIGMRETYDIVMPDPDHNFILANGIVTHNSHTCSYAMISYWCAWMKAYFPLEYAAACLRGAKDDDGRLAVLRELTQEGVEYVSFDVLQSDLDWKAIDGRLIGGFKNFKGIGDAKAAKLIEDRRAGRLDIAKLEKHELKFADLYPLMTKYRQWYADAEAQGCEEGSQVLTSNKFPSEGIVLYIGRIFEKRPFDFNEPARVTKRNGKIYDGNTLSIDFRTKDDLGEAIICRVDRFNWENVGAPSNDALAVGDDILVRGQRIPGFTLINIHKMMCLNKPDLKWAIKPRRGWR